MERRRLLILGAALVAALGVALVLVYARGADQRAEARFDGVEVMVATQRLAPGETVAAARAAGKIDTARVARGALLDGAVRSLDELKGDVVLVPVYPGEQLIQPKFGAAGDAQATLPIPPGQMAVSVNLTDAARVSGFLVPGSEVAVFLNGTTEDTAQPFTRLLLPRVTILGVGSSAPAVDDPENDADGEGAASEEVAPTLLTIAVGQRDAQKVLYAAATGELAFALLNGESTVDSGPAVTSENLFR